MSADDFSFNHYIVATTPSDSGGGGGDPKSSGKDYDSSSIGGPFASTSYSGDPSGTVTDSVTNDAVPFQLPSFLLGAPTPAAGGGADAFPGTFSNLGDFGNWLGGTGSSFHESGDLFSKAYSPGGNASFPLVPVTLNNQSQSQRLGPLDFGGESAAAKSTSATSSASPPAPHPSTTLELASNFSSLPLLPSSSVTGRKAPPLYSTTGFDMLAILARVASRPNPQIVLGPVDLSCSFVVVDVQRYDHPVIYASPTFFKLTGYDAHEVIGRNCRFLQSPDGIVERGAARSFTDQTAVAHIKKCLIANKECQANLMNYRKGGIPFLNLISIIPITASDDSDEIKFHVGFQVDLVHQPNAILQTMRDGTYLVNYSNMSAPSAGLGRPSIGGRMGEGQSRDVGGLPLLFRELSGVLLPGGPAEIAKKSDEQNRSDFFAMLLENADDLVHVLSVKGVLQYASPALLHLLEYTADEIIGMTIADIAHPQDLTPINRELKDASTLIETASTTSSHMNILSQKTVHLLYRVRRKRSGMVWLEASGRLHMEPGKTRKSIIFSGRLRHVPTLTWRSVEQMGGLGGLSTPNEFWARLSYMTGLFVWVEKRVDEILGYDRDELLGISLMSLVDVEARSMIREALSKVIAPNADYAGNDNDPSSDEGQTPVTIKTTMTSRRDNVKKHAEINFFPADTIKKPSLNFSLPDVTVAGPSSLLVHIRILPVMPELALTSATKRTWRVTGHSAMSPIYDELDVARGTNWNYEVETVRQHNEKMRVEMSALLSEREETGLNLKRKREETTSPIPSEA